MKNLIRPYGFIRCKIKYKNTNEVRMFEFSNQVLNNGRKYLANSLLESGKKLWIANMLFGDGGTSKEEPVEVSPYQDKLSGVIRLRKPVVARLIQKYRHN